ncbi:chromate transporter [Paenibacillus sp. FSL W8-0919]|uniref:chromate transporter n=1 Tax=Paenibacillus sp. FSL W8-0919 TaxID=2954707 RepID=UPI0030F64933
MNDAQSRRFKLLRQLFGVFFRIGPSTFGGGYAMIAMIEQEIVHKKGWMNEEEMAEMMAIAGSAPGGVAVNSSAFIGYRLAGILGAVTAVFAITLPTFMIVFLLSLLSTIFKDNEKVTAALQGIHASIVALIIVAACKMWKSSILDAATLMIAAIAVLLLLFTSIHSLYLILGGPLAGIAVVLCKRKLGMAVRTEKPPYEEKREMQYPEYYI